MSLLFPRHSARRGIFTGKFSSAPVSLHPPYSVPVSGHLPCPPPAPPLPSLLDASIRGRIGTLRLSMQTHPCRAPSAPRSYKIRRKNPFPQKYLLLSHAEAAPAAASFQKIQNKATKYENRVDIFKRFRYNKRKRGRLRVASTTALHKKVWKHSLIQPDNRHPVDSITDFRRDCKRIRKIRGFIVAPFSGEGPCRDALGCVPRDGFFVFVR